MVILNMNHFADVLAFSPCRAFAVSKFQSTSKRFDKWIFFINTSAIKSELIIKSSTFLVGWNAYEQRKKISFLLFSLLWHRQKAAITRNLFVYPAWLRGRKKNIKLATFFHISCVLVVVVWYALKITRDWVHWTEAQFCLIENAKGEDGVSEWAVEIYKGKDKMKSIYRFLSSCENLLQFSAPSLSQRIFLGHFRMENDKHSWQRVCTEA
jgi:hypothetical protein